MAEGGGQQGPSLPSCTDRALTSIVPALALATGRQVSGEGSTAASCAAWDGESSAAATPK